MQQYTSCKLSVPVPVSVSVLCTCLGPVYTFSFSSKGPIKRSFRKRPYSFNLLMCFIMRLQINFLPIKVLFLTMLVLFNQYHTNTKQLNNIQLYAET